MLLRFPPLDCPRRSPCVPNGYSLACFDARSRRSHEVILVREEAPFVTVTACVRTAPNGEGGRPTEPAASHGELLAE